MLGDDRYSGLFVHVPTSSQEPLLGRFHGDKTLCTSCHPPDCPDPDCDGFYRSDVTEGHVGQACDQCGKQLAAGGEREA
jgi:hypothetical protein